MKAVVLNEQRDVKVQDIDQPVCEPGHVLLKVGYCGICGNRLARARPGHFSSAGRHGP